MKNAIIIFTRAPLPGMTKTRLMPFFSPAACAKLHRCFLQDIEKECRRVEADVYIAYTPENAQRDLVPIFGHDRKYFPQGAGNLGDRMYHGIQKVLTQNYDACILIGTDIPELKAEHIKQGFAVLQNKDIVLGPTNDGGYYLVGMKVPECKVFAQNSYGHGNVLEQTTRYLRSQGITIGYTARLTDIDRPEDVRKFKDQMRNNRKLQRTETGKYLLRNSKISIIVPIYNEEATIGRMQEQLRPLKGRCEIIFVDGGSSDRTLERISSEFRLLHSQKGRQHQMNLGARKSSGEILFFLHCDSELPRKPLEQIRYVMKDYRVGCFGIAFHSCNFFMFTCRIISNHRIKDRKVMFGDQGIFIDRSLFFAVGMFPDLPIMEDYQFSLTLKARGERIGITKDRIYTSDRRFPIGTLEKLKMMWKMNRLRKMYRDGADIAKIADAYRDIR